MYSAPLENKSKCGFLIHSLVENSETKKKQQFTQPRAVFGHTHRTEVLFGALYYEITLNCLNKIEAPPSTQFAMITQHIFFG